MSGWNANQLMQEDGRIHLLQKEQLGQPEVSNERSLCPDGYFII